MKQLVLSKARSVQLQNVGEPVAIDGYVKVRVHYCGVCGSDLVSFRESLSSSSHWGHEVVGVVGQLGSRVEGLQLGDTVVLKTTNPCGHCNHCKTQGPGNCTHWKRFGFNGFSEHVVLPEALVVHLDTPKPVPELVLLEPLYVALDIAEKCARTTTPLLIGCGTIGLLVLHILRQRGVQHVDVAMRNHSGGKYQMAKAWGANILKMSEVVGENLTRKYDVVVVTAPYSFIAAATCVARFGGKVIFNGISSESIIQLDCLRVHLNRIEIVPSFPHPQLSFDPATSYLHRHAADLRRLITDVIPLNESPILFDRVASASYEGIKALVACVP